MHMIISNSADEAWRRVANLLLGSTDVLTQPSRGGETSELLHVALEIEDPSQRWVISRTPSMNPAFALVESFWIAAGRRDAALPTYWNPRLRNYCGDAPNYHGAYGYRLRHQLGLDQLDRVYRALLAAPDTRQCVLQIWNSAIDMPREDGSPVDPDIPCSVLAFPKLRKGQLQWLQVIRSSDLFLGVPHNIVQFTILQEILSGWLGVRPGSYVQVSDSMHIYTRDLGAISSSLPIDPPRSSDSYALDRITWEKTFPHVMQRLEKLALPTLSTNGFRAVAFSSDAPTAYENAVLVAAADSARRHGWKQEIEECVDRCTNSALRLLWSRWLARCDGMQSANAKDAGNT
jgi:thymidylate synthase